MTSIETDEISITKSDLYEALTAGQDFRGKKLIVSAPGSNELAIETAIKNRVQGIRAKVTRTNQGSKLEDDVYKVELE